MPPFPAPTLLPGFGLNFIRWCISLVAIGLCAVHGAPRPDLPADPAQQFGALYADVERSGIFADQKTFADAEPVEAPGTIVAAYRQAKSAGPAMDLRQFVALHFRIHPPAAVAVPPEPDLRAHLNELWGLLERPAFTRPHSSLLPLPERYVVPGGRFQELYYWDTYFTMLGLEESGRRDLVRAMADDFASEIRDYGLIPNGNRTYYLSRSQPPFFALMVELLAQDEGAAAYVRYRPALAAEEAYWADETLDTRHTVTMPDGSRLSRYFDREARPRPEAFLNDEKAARSSGRAAPEVYRDLRSAAESGWDFSSRWLADGRRLETITTTTIVPVDLNALLVQLERTLARADGLAGYPAAAAAMQAKANARQAAMQRNEWSSEAGFFVDFDLARGRLSPAPTLAGMMPLFLHLATPQEAAAAAGTLERRFLRAGGVVTTLVRTGQQWDAPNGWAPLQWITVEGLKNYGFDRLAETVARRWIRLNSDVYLRTGRMMEKYNVEDVSLVAGGGEYPAQDGFGWTNGVLLGLLREYGPYKRGADSPVGANVPGPAR